MQDLINSTPNVLKTATKMIFVYFFINNKFICKRKKSKKVTIMAKKMSIEGN